MAKLSLNKRQKELIAKAFDPPKPKAKPATAASRKAKLNMMECPAEYGYFNKQGKCVEHKEAKKPEGPSLKKSIKRGVKQQIKLLKKGLIEDGKIVL